MIRGRPRDWLAPVLISLLLNLGLFVLVIHWIVLEIEPKEAYRKQVTASPERPDQAPPPEHIEEPPEPEQPQDGPALPLMASEPWLIAPLAPDDDLRIMPEAVPPGLFDFPEGPAAPGPVRRHGHRTGVGTTEAPPRPEVTVHPDEPVPDSEPEPGALPESLLAGLKRSGHLAVTAPQLHLRGTTRQQIVERITEHRVYPDQAVDLGLEGRVMMRFRLDAHGRVRDLAATNAEDVDPLLVEGARRSIEAGTPYPVPETVANGTFYLAVACWTDGEGAVKRLRMIESTGRDAVDSVARDRARAACAEKPLGWHVVEFDHAFAVRVGAQGDRFEARLVEGTLPRNWAEAIRTELPDLVPPMAATAAIQIPITFKLTW